MHVSFETSIVINLKMTISELILTLPPDTKSLIRSIEKTNRKIINTELSQRRVPLAFISILPGIHANHTEKWGVPLVMYGG